MDFFVMRRPKTTSESSDDSNWEKQHPHDKKLEQVSWGKVSQSSPTWNRKIIGVLAQ